jgi:hypothetical protein
MGPNTRREYLATIRPRYLKADKAGKSRILDEFCAVCDYRRKYAIRLLRRPPPRTRRRPGPRPRYDQAVLAPLKAIWLAAEQPCSKRLKAALALWLPHYERQQPLTEALRCNLLSISPATMDRLLAPLRARRHGKGLCGTRPGSLLRTQIPIRCEPWDEARPGFLETDTVAHCGSSLSGDFIWSLTYTDIATGWTENRAVWNKGARDVVRQTREVEASLPFALLGFDSDNGSEFLNNHLYRYFCKRKRPVAFTRSRPYKKNDQAHVEQKNWTHVRQLLGYERLERRELVPLINELYRAWGLLHNFFCPTLKLAEKRREGARLIRRYAPPQTACQRLLASPQLEGDLKLKLLSKLNQLEPFALKKQVESRLKLVFDTARKLDASTMGGPTHPPFP